MAKLLIVFTDNHGHNKKLEVTLGDNISLNMVLTNDKSPTDLVIDPPVWSSHVKLRVLSYYSQGMNGFAAIRIWTSSTIVSKSVSE